MTAPLRGLFPTSREGRGGGADVVLRSIAHIFSHVAFAICPSLVWDCSILCPSADEELGVLAQ